MFFEHPVQAEEEEAETITRFETPNKTAILRL